MSKQRLSGLKSVEEKKARPLKTAKTEESSSHPEHSAEEVPSLSGLQHQVGNQAVQRLIAQRSGEGAFELDEETAASINQQRGGGQALDESARERMQAATGVELGDVRVHTSPEADALNQQLGAKAFTTGKDIYFREGAYDPNSSGGQELLTHELTHVVQQGSGALSGGGRMHVNAPGDVFEQQADTVAKDVVGPASPGVQLQEEEEEVQMQEEEEEEEAVQMQEEEEEEETVQTQEEEEEVQMQEMPEEEELAAS